MKNKILITLILVFALNTISLSAFAAKCPELPSKVEKTQSDMPDCHKKAQEQKKSTHCKGLCFCMHAQLSHSILNVEPTFLKGEQVKASVELAPVPLRISWLLAPPFRPPMAIS